jgi:transposase-like protein
VTETARQLGHHRCTVYAWLAALRERASSAGLDIYVGPNPTNSTSAE